MKQSFTVRRSALDGVEVFLSVARHRSFRKRLRNSALHRRRLARRYVHLRHASARALFIRTTRSVGLTEAGERFLSRAKPAFEELVAASEAARDLGQRPAGSCASQFPGQLFR